MIGIKKLTYEFVKSKFEERGYELLDTKYINNSTPMMYLCPTHGKQEITYANLRNSKGCHKCAYEAMSEQRRFPYEFIKSKFEERGYTLLETEYINSKTHMRYLCNKCHTEQKIMYLNLHHGYGCPNCGGTQRHTFEYIKQYFDNCGYTLLSNTYENARQKLKYLCALHGEQETTFNRLQSGCRCPQCKSSKGEQMIQQWLDDNGITYATQYTFNDLIHKDKLKFDFCIFEVDNKTIRLLIEYQGKQHYEPIDFASKGQEWAEEQFHDNQLKDQLKIDYCTTNNIPLLHLPYTEINNISKILDPPDKLQEFFICHPIANIKE